MSFSTIKTFDPYAVMDIDRTATIDQIKSKFRKLTLKYHPDRNRRKRGYSPKIYNDICKAYAILSNPNNRKEFDNQFAPSWMDLREATRDFMSTQNKQSKSLTELQAERSASQPARPSFSPRDKFGDGDLAAFNQMFDKTRSADPNDHGYGDGMTERMTEKDAKSWSSSVTDIRHENMFKGKSFSDQEFNRLFEERSSRDASKEIIERNEIDPSAFSLASQHDYTDIAVHDHRMIVGRDIRDYTKSAKKGGGLGWVDYKQGFQTISSTVPDSVKQRYNNNESIDRLFQQRMAEQSKNPYDDIPENDRKTFAQAKEAMIKKKLREIEREEKLHKDIVFKYKSQYGDNYLEHKTHKTHKTSGTELPHPSQFASSPHNPHQSQLRTPTRAPPSRIHRYQAHAMNTNNTAPSTSSGFHQQTRDKDSDAKNINDRMNERNFML